MSLLHSRGSPTKGNKIRIGCLNHAFSGAQKWAEQLRNPCILGGLQKKAAKSELAATAMPFRGPKSGRKCHVTPAFSGVPNKGEQNQNWLPQSCLLGGPKVGGSAMLPLHSRGAPTKSSKIKIGCLSHAFSVAQNWAELLCYPCILGGPQQRASKSESELAASAMASQGPKSGRRCYVTHAFSGVPNNGDQNQNSLPQPCLLGGPKVGGSATPPLHSLWSPTKRSKIRIGCLSHAFSGIQKWAEVLCYPCIQGGPQQRGAKSESAAPAMPSPGPKSGRRCYSTPAFVESETTGRKIRIGCPSHGFSGAQK